jgi:cytochrome c
VSQKSLNKIIKEEDISFAYGHTFQITDHEEFKAIVSEFPWMSYHSDFNEIQGYTTDSGWGCMIRVGQMMLAKTHLILQNTYNQQLRVRIFLNQKFV